MTDWVSGFPVGVILAALAAYLTWHVVNVWRLHFWIKRPDRKLPRSLGIWAGIYSRIDSMERRNRDQERRYQVMIGDFQNLTDALPDATLIIDGNSRLLWFNKAAGELLGLKEPKDIGRPVSNLVPNAGFTRWLASRGERENGLEFTSPGKENTWFDVSATSIRANRRLIVLRDMSEIHKVDRIRKDFVTNVSHELRTPLTVMRGYLELFQDRPADEMSDAIDRMHTQAIQMQSMLDDLLELSRLQAVDSHDEEEHVDVAAMLMQLREQAEEISRGNHVLRFEVDDKLAMAGIKSDLESAFRNLIVNALKYTPEGGTVTVGWHNSHEGPTLAVSDTGIGIPKRDIPRLTERFYRVGSHRGRESGGTGLGLAIVKHVLNGHQARFEIESEYGVGSRFSCIFPRERVRF